MCYSNHDNFNVGEDVTCTKECGSNLTNTIQVLEIMGQSFIECHEIDRPQQQAEEGNVKKQKTADCYMPKKKNVVLTCHATVRIPNVNISLNQGNYCQCQLR